MPKTTSEMVDSTTSGNMPGENAPASKAEQTAAAPTTGLQSIGQQQSSIETTKSPVYRGKHFPSKVHRNFSTPDPSNPARMITVRKPFDLITYLVLNQVSGVGYTDAGEKYITLSGQYAPFAKARITASAQNADSVLEWLHGRVDKSPGKTPLPLLKPITVEVVCTQMKGFGFNIQELYELLPDGSRKAVIAAEQEASQEENAELSFL
jgi:hypothetical protein